MIPTDIIWIAVGFILYFVGLFIRRKIPNIKLKIRRKR